MEPRETPVKTHTNNRAGWPIRVLSLSIGVREPAGVSFRSQSWRTCLIRVPGAVEVSNVRLPGPVSLDFPLEDPSLWTEGTWYAWSAQRPLTSYTVGLGESCTECQREP